MAKVLTMGEALIDVVIRADGSAMVHPGGAMLNTAVSLGRCGVDVAFAGIVGADRQGEHIQAFLRDNGVSVSDLQSVGGFATPLAMAWLNKEKEASYSFYKGNTPLQQQPYPDLEAGDVFLFGSFYSLNKEIRDSLKKYLRENLNKGIFNIYDPNFRSSHKKELKKVFPWIKENMSNSNFVRASNEDMKEVFDIDNGDDAWSVVRDFGPEAFVYTMGKKGAIFYADGLKEHMPSMAKEIVSTVGAGDAFNAGLINALITMGCRPGQTWKREEARCILEEGSRFSAKVCGSMGNYIPPDPDQSRISL